MSNIFVNKIITGKCTLKGAKNVGLMTLSFCLPSNLSIRENLSIYRNQKMSEIKILTNQLTLAYSVKVES